MRSLKSMLSFFASAMLLLATGATQMAVADVPFSGTGKLCWIDFSGAVGLPSGPTAGLVYFFEVDANDARLDGWQINFETQDLKKNGRGTVMGHLELYPEATDNVLTGIYAFKNTAPTFSSYYLGSDGLVVEYEVSGGTEVNTCEKVRPEVCDDFECEPPFGEGNEGRGVETYVTGTIYE